MNLPVPMPTARQGTEYIRLEHEGHPIEALRAAKALVKEEDLNPYHAAKLHLKLADVPEIGLYHASEGVKTLTQLRETDDSRDIRWKLQEAENAMQEAQTIEKAWSKRLDTMTPETRETAVANRYNDYFSKHERDELSSRETETEKPCPLEFEYPVKKGRTADSGGEKEEKEKKKLQEYEEARKFLAS
ncbi:hypothetical protein FNAPI_756 [Fusarium napiforme]|uniref:Uncharacterized protein n=1 Tax=Fusarium napiforme TaxID=42672 RepID=A0A8H5K3S6_9HYPO|nr:hypothetical protein FNAPI_756 [Fusarium napiforme]